MQRCYRKKKTADGCPHKEGLWKFKRLDLEIFIKITVPCECFIACEVIRTALPKTHLISDQDVLGEILTISFSES